MRLIKSQMKKIQLQATHGHSGREDFHPVHLQRTEGLSMCRCVKGIFPKFIEEEMSINKLF